MFTSTSCSPVFCTRSFFACALWGCGGGSTCWPLAKSVSEKRRRCDAPSSWQLLSSTLRTKAPDLAPNVRACLVKRVAIVGAESTGKTTLAEELARHFDTVWVPEYGREYTEVNV